jgi:hypothetical protein
VFKRNYKFNGTNADEETEKKKKRNNDKVKENLSLLLLLLLLLTGNLSIVDILCSFREFVT